jgi:hypothetical protein
LTNCMPCNALLLQQQQMMIQQICTERQIKILTLNPLNPLLHQLHPMKCDHWTRVQGSKYNGRRWRRRSNRVSKDQGRRRTKKRRALNIKNGGMPMCFDTHMRTLLRSYLQDLSAEDRLVHIKVRAKQPLPAVLEKTPEKKYITKLHCGPGGRACFLYTK